MGPRHDELLSAQRRRTSIGSGSASERSHRPGALGIVADIFRRVSGADQPLWPVHAMLHFGRDEALCPWGSTMKRREFITLLGGAAAWPLQARAQQGERMRRLAVLMGTGADDAIGQARLAAFLQGLGQLDWMVGRNVRIDVRWTAADADHTRGYAAELVALALDVILASTGSVVGPLRRLTRTVPIVFTETADPVGAGFVETLARPGGNVTGFLSFEYGLSGKWLELLKQIAPPVTRVA